MIRLYLSCFWLLGRRWLRSWGYQGERPAPVLVLILSGTTLGALAAATWAHSQFADLEAKSAQLRYLLVLGAVILLFFLAGPVLLLTESVRASGSRFQTVLSGLPLAGREIMLLMWLPTFTMSLLLLVMLWIPGVAALSALRFSWYQSAIDSLLSLLAGYAMAAAVIAGVRAMLARSTWTGIQYPIMLLVWMALNGVEMWRMGGPIATENPTLEDHLLMVPWLVQEIVTKGGPSLLGTAAVLAAAVVSVGLLVGSAGLPLEARHATVTWRWSRRWRPELVTLELTRLLRSRHLVANLIGAELIIAGMAFTIWKVPVELRPFLAKPLLAVIMMVSCVPLLGIRGLTKSRLPVPLLLRYGPLSWTGSQVLAGLALATPAAIPGALAFWLLQISPGVIATWSLCFLVASAGLAIGIGWSVPASADNPISQVMSSFLLVLAVGWWGTGSSRAGRLGGPSS